MKLEVGKTYRTKDGRKVLVKEIYGHDNKWVSGKLEGDYRNLLWRISDGSYFHCDTTDEKDLIEEVKEEKMHTFKVWDRVKLLVEERSHCRVQKGDIVTITKLDSDIHNEHLETITNSGKEWFIYKKELKNYELVESELEQLVKKANEGFRAFDEARKKYPGKIQGEADTCPSWSEVDSWGKNLYVRIKPQKQFEPFITSNGHAVKLVARTLSIGCQNINMEAAKLCLTVLCGGNSQYYLRGNDGTDLVKATRTGVSLNDNSITWADADRILKQLNELE